MNALHDDIDDEKEIGHGNSDSGVHTEDAPTTTTASPEIGISSTHLLHHDVDTIEQQHQMPVIDNLTNHTKRKSISKRETKLLLEHESTKEFVAATTTTSKSNSNTTTTVDENDIAQQIELLEQIVAINKRLQREEELALRLNAKIRKYQSDDPTLSEAQIKDALKNINTNIDHSTTEIEKMQHEILISGEMLEVKSDVINRLSKELEELEITNSNTNTTTTIDQNQIQTELELSSTNSNTINYYHPTSLPIAAPYQQQNSLIAESTYYTTSYQPIPSTAYYSNSSLIPNNPYPIVTVDQLILSPDSQYFQKKNCEIAAVNLLNHKATGPTNATNVTSLSFDQRNFNSPMNTLINLKVGPKKFLNGFYKDPDSDTGISSLGEDGSQLGTLV